jgi:hypothetical protein
MSGRESLGSYLADVEKRLRLRAWMRGLAGVAAVALAATVGLVLAADTAAFSPRSVLAARVTLGIAIAAAFAAGVLVPLGRLGLRQAARRAEQEYPEFEQRLLTFAEKSPADDPFLELLAADAGELASRTDTRSFAPRPILAAFGAAALICVGALVWLVTLAPGFLGHGAALLWGATGRTGPEPFYEIVVEPGDASVRRGGNQAIRATVRGIETAGAKIHARYSSASKWEETAMLPRENGTGFEFLFAGIAESAEYYVTSGKLASKRFRLSVIDLPAVKRIKVAYRFPSWLGVREAARQDGGDLRAVAGTEAELTIETDRPLANGVLVIDGANQVKLEAAGDNQVRAKVTIEKDGQYHVAALDHGAPVRLTEDFFIEAQIEKPPVLAVRRPGRDARVSPIEEVVVAVEGEDDFALEAMELHYSVNGSAEKTVPLLSKRGQKQASGETMIALEDYKLVPGDIVALYATARDARSTSKSDIYFLEAQPWEREFTQSQTMGGGGGGGEGNEQNRISQRQKEIIAATWNQSRQAGKNRAEAAENAKFLSDVQAKLRDQAQTLARRMRSRELSGVNQEFSSFSKDMDEAAAAMTAASEKLKAQNWREALPSEQKALQHLLRAEATFRQIQVAFGSRGGGGGGGGGGSGRDLENMFDLELDLEKNQYEAGQQRGSAEQRQREVDEALQRLEQLARRQQELARQQAQQRQQSFQQRWQQEMLRREAEQLQRRMEQLSRDSGGQSGQPQGGQQQSANSQGSGSQGSSGQPSGSRASASGSQTQQRLNRMTGRSQPSAGDRRIQEALDRLQQAQEDMRRAAQSGGQNPADSRRAAERLEEARNLIGGMRRQEASGQLDDLAERAERLASAQREHGDQLRKMFAGQSGQGQQGQGQQARAQANSEEVKRIAGEKDRMQADLQRLEKDMQQAARDLAGTERSASSKVREALGDLQQDEIATRMRFNAEYLRRGYGPNTWMREAPVTAGLNRLQEQLRDARGALGGGRQQAGQGNLEQNLARVERLRSQLEQAMRNGRQAGRGPQGGSQQQGQQGGGQQQGQQAGGQQQGQQGGGGGQDGRAMGGGRGGDGDRRGQQRGGWRTGDETNAANFGDLTWDGRIPANPGAGFDRAYREGLRDLQALREGLRADPEASREILDAIREIERLDPGRFPGNPELVERLRSQTLMSIEQLELLLRRKLDDQQSGQVRSTAGERVPQGYGAAVAEYYRRLSKAK